MGWIYMAQDWSPEYGIRPPWVPHKVGNLSDQLSNCQFITASVFQSRNVSDCDLLGVQHRVGLLVDINMLLPSSWLNHEHGRTMDLWNVSAYRSGWFHSSINLKQLCSMGSSPCQYMQQECGTEVSETLNTEKWSLCMNNQHSDNFPAVSTSPMDPTLVKHSASQLRYKYERYNLDQNSILDNILKLFVMTQKQKYTTRANPTFYLQH
jgi:hypothetical protein